MQIVIDIPERIYDTIQDDEMISREQLVVLQMHILKGTPLPKGHGKLIILSEDAVKKEQTFLSFSCQSWISDVGLSNATVAIIESDKAESEMQE